MMSEVELKERGSDGDAIAVPSKVSVDFALGAHSEYVKTSFGDVHVSIVGDRKKPPMIGYHDLGLNHRTCFGSFVSFPDNKAVLDSVCLYFIDAPGAEDEAPQWPSDKPFPNFNELVEQIHEVAIHYKLNTAPVCFGIGVGLGAVLLLHYAIKYPKEIAGLLLTTFNWKVLSYSELAYYKQLAYYLYYYPSSVWPRDELMIRYFGRVTLEQGYDSVSAYQAEFSRMDPVNLYHLINDAYIQRPDITADLKKLRARTVIFAGWDSAFREIDIELVGLLDRNETSFLEFKDKGGLLTEECPNVYSTPMKFFFQAFGMCLPQLDLDAINKRLQAIGDSDDSDDESDNDSDDKTDDVVVDSDDDITTLASKK